MKHPVRLYSPAAPDFGGLDGRFGALFAAYHAAPSSRLGASAVIAFGAVAGLTIAGVM
jgi:hypothetical protein